MKKSIVDYEGKKFWNVTVLKESESNGEWIFKCDCGNTFSAFPSRVLSGHKKSCGCRKTEMAKTHGVNGDPFYHTWWAMMRRCYHRDSHNYERYGGRGISVCDEWHDPVVFISWARETVGEKKAGLTLDRIDNDKGYSPQNCRWATASEQSNNRRNTLMVEYNGEMIALADLAREKNLNLNRLRARIFSLGWSVEKALTTEKCTSPTKTSRRKSKEKGILIDGEFKTITEWCKIFGTDRNLAYQRISRGWDCEAAIKTHRKTEWITGHGGVCKRD